MKLKFVQHGIAALGVAAAITALPLYAQTAAGTAGTPTTGTKANVEKATAAGTESSGKIKRADADMMRDLAQANVSEIATAKLALSKSQNDDVKKFAQKMIDDHTSATQDLQKLADEKGVKLPTEPDAKHKAAAKLLEKASPETFDKNYMKEAGLSDHKKTHNLLAKIEKKGTDPDLKALAAKVMPVVDGHLKDAEQITGKK